MKEVRVGIFVCHKCGHIDNYIFEDTWFMVLKQRCRCGSALTTWTPHSRILGGKEMAGDTGESLRPGDDLNKAGVKLDRDKLPMHLVAWDCIRRLATILQHGAKKYAPRNWEAGMNWSRPYDAAMRHLTDFWNGEDLDPDSGLPHLDHAFCNIMFLMRYSTHRKAYDDRPHGEKNGNSAA